MKKSSVAIIMGSQSDLVTMSAAAEALKEFKVSYHIEIVSAHRTPDKMYEFSKTAAEKGFQIIIAGAGGAAHLPGMVASLTTLPVIGVPVTIGKLKGLDALLSIAQMPKGVPVATMAVDNAYNAGLLAVRILALQDSGLQKKIEAFQKKQSLKVKKMNKTLKK
ncbi:MAG: 5-(carboxyamino)imidazole ribonucleotide mutase [Bdellovibrio sp.]|nr:5-(carboxyamino)imidazole ribonucleotide mutase [Bdellovibrio sp.]